MVRFPRKWSLSWVLDEGQATKITLVRQVSSRLVTPARSIFPFTLPAAATAP